MVYEASTMVGYLIALNMLLTVLCTAVIIRAKAWEWVSVRRAYGWFLSKLTKARLRREYERERAWFTNTSVEIPSHGRWGEGSGSTISHWVPTDNPNGEPFMATHLPHGGVFKDEKLPPDTYIIHGTAGDESVAEGEPFRAAHQKALVYSIVSTRTLAPAVSKRTLVKARSTEPGPSEEEQDDLVKEYNLGSVAPRATGD